MSTKRSIALVFNFVPNSNRSMESFILEFTKKMVGFGWNIIMAFSGEPSSSFRHSVAQMGVLLIVSKPALGIKSALSLGKILRLYRPFILFTAFYSVFDPSSWLLKIYSGANCWIARSESSGSYVKKNIFGEVLRKVRSKIVNRLVTEIVACSIFVRDRNIKLGIKPNKVITIHNGINTDKFVPATKNNDVVIAFAGQIIPEKGIETLLSAMSTLPQKCHLKVAGVGWQRPSLEKMALDLNISVDWLGQIGWVHRLFAESQIVVVPSIWAEAFGFVVAEAMACATCVITSDAGGMPEVIGDAGLIFGAGDAAALRELLVLTMGNPELRRQLGTSARNRVVQYFDINKMVDGFVSLFHEVYELYRSKR
jgi:glycosyltransferase involved in cell wall biosynthesis